ncbi:T9SS type A sorting domain-containing protein [Aequorivita capsosiphonis]|uniref:T9SS type A sorting domain-containing protein n=1 Tax=Aequorivita capsosiphonis TaxID=487317 RepID=UPI0004273E17|nr:T9SS type A sorting domain-containing protein [Aequorivita capsosiphonis]
MKQIVVIASFLIFGTAAFSQNYKPLLDTINEWHVTSCYFGCHTDVYYTDSDTIVDGKTYKILDGYHFISRTFLLREDVANRKVYLNIVNQGFNEDFLLYDFSLSEGDVFNMKNPISPFPEDGGAFLLDSIVAKPLADGNNYNHFYFSPAPGNTTSTNNAVWIEGAGSLSLINAPGGKPDINGAGHLSCFFKNTEIFYANLDSIDDCIPLHLGIKKDNLKNLVVSKQNNSNNCLLSNTQDVKNVSVFDISGKRLHGINNEGRNSIGIDLSDYQNGVYIILATGFGDTKKSFKIVK